jgi:glycosyltransferase involved in cell wall biosynthesis
VVICRAPEHGNLFVLPLVRLLGFTPVIWIVSDRDEVAYAYEVRRRNGFRMVAGRILGRIIGAVENHFVRRCAVVANGEELSRKARQLKVTNTDQVLPVISTTLSAVNIVGKTGQRPADGTKELLYVGRLAPEKGLYDLLPAFRQLLDHHEQKLRLRLVGWGAAGEEGRLRLEAERLGLTSLVSFQGLVPHGPELFSYYRRAEIFVLPSRAEGTPRVLVEAMAHGLPIVATDVGGIPSMVRSGENALLVPPGRPAALVEALDRLLRDPFLVARMSDANVKRARDYTVEGLARRMAGFLADRIPEGVAGKIA